MQIKTDAFGVGFYFCLHYTQERGLSRDLARSGSKLR
jgi:hypothetical protein